MNMDRSNTGQRWIGFALALLALIGLAGSAKESDWKICEDDNLPPARIIAACSNVIRAGDTNFNLSIAHKYRGYAYKDVGNLDSALSDFTRGITLDPTVGDNYHGRALVYAVRKDFAKALEDIDRALARAKDKRRGLFVRGGILVDMNRLEEAHAAYEHLVRLDPTSDDTAAHHSLANTLLKLGRRSEAIALLRVCVRVTQHDTIREGCKKELRGLSAE